jgi:leucyl-tRNA synthetase
VEVNGRVKAHIMVKTGSSESEVKAAVLNLEQIKPHLVGETVKRAVYVPDKLINLVI